MIQFFIAIMMVPLLGYGLTLFPWNPLPPEFATSLGSVFAYLYAFDQVMPIHEAVTIFFLMAGVEITIAIFNFASAMLEFFAGRHSPRIN